MPDTPLDRAAPTEPSRDPGPPQVPVTLATARLTLRRPASDDTDRIVAALSDWEVTRWLARAPYPYGPDDATSWMTSIATGNEAVFVLDAGAGCIGAISLVFHDPRDPPTLGYWLARTAWGRGYMSEAARALLDYGFGTLNADAVRSGHIEGNAASARVLQKLGFRFTNIETVYSVPHQKDLPHRTMRLERSQWTG